MRIAMVCEHANPSAAGDSDSGGLSADLADLSRALAEAGHRVTVWTHRCAPDTSSELPLAPGVTVRRLDAGAPTRIPTDQPVAHVPAMAAGLERAWRGDPPEVVHAHGWTSGLAASAAAGRVAGGLPLVQTFAALGHVQRRHHGAVDQSPDGRIQAERAVARRADRVIAGCDDERSELTRMGAPRSRVRVVPVGVNLERFHPDGPASPRPERVPRLLSVGRLTRREGVDELVQALRGVPRAELVVAGGPPAGEGAETDVDLGRLRGVAERTGVAGRVRFVGGMPRSGMPALLRSADVAVCVPWYEPFGRVPLEAMACGTAVVASAVGGLTEAVVDRVTGLHVPPGRPGTLAAVLRELLAQPVLMQAYGIAGRDRAVSRFSWERIAAATARVYAEAAEHRAGRDGTAGLSRPPTGT